ncbi:MAG: hypothetical protein WBD67_08140 [Terracidiphilus sp.]
MNQWREPSEAWEPVLQGRPARSHYFWMAIIFSVLALIGIVSAAGKIRDIPHGIAIWAPTLVGFLAAMALAGAGAIRAIASARSEDTEALRKVAFEKFRTYFFCAAFVFLATQLMTLLL